MVQDVIPHQAEPSAPVIHRVTLDCLDDDRLGETLDVIWEREVHTAVHDVICLPRLEVKETWPGRALREEVIPARSA